jgi:hypothetical protein
MDDELKATKEFGSSSDRGKSSVMHKLSAPPIEQADMQVLPNIILCASQNVG